jgi:heat shock protein 4
MQIGPFQSSKGEEAKLEVKVCLNIHGIVSLESATVTYNTPFCHLSLK